jgi:hypothetical protein
MHQKEGIMKRVFLLFAILIGGVIAGVIAGLALPAEWRAKLSRSLVAPIGHCLGHMPHE